MKLVLQLFSKWTCYIDRIKSVQGKTQLIYRSRSLHFPSRHPNGPHPIPRRTRAETRHQSQVFPAVYNRVILVTTLLKLLSQRLALKLVFSPQTNHPRALKIDLMIMMKSQVLERKLCCVEGRHLLTLIICKTCLAFCCSQVLSFKMNDFITCLKKLKLFLKQKQAV